MLRSKATAALLKLKEIDRKYKIRSSEDAKLQSSLSDISTVDSKDDISKHLTGSGDKPDEIINIRPKLDIRMPDTHMERSTTVKKNETELVTIFNKVKKRSPRSESHDFEKIQTTDEITEKLNFGLQTVGRENAYEEKLQEIKSFGNSPLVISEEKIVDTETSISEDVPDVVSSSHPVSNNLEANFSKEITLKSVDSIIDGAKSVQSELDEDLSTLVVSGTYSDDFVKTLSSENERASRNVMVDEAAVIVPELTSSEVKHVSSTSPSYYQRQKSSELQAKHTETETEDIEELISAKVLPVDANLDASLTNEAKKIEHDVSKEVVSPGSLLKQRSSQSSSARSSKEHRRRRRSNTSSTYRDSKSPEIPSSYRQKTEPESTNTSGSSNLSKSNHQSGKNHSERNRSGIEKDLKNVAKVSPRKLQEGENEVNGVSWSSKEEAVAFIRREKVATKLKKVKNLKSGTRAKDSSIKKSPPNYPEDNKMHKFTSVIQPVPVTMVGPVSNFLKFSKDDEIASRPAIYRGKNRCLNKQKTGDSPRSRHRTKGGSLGHCKNQTKEEPGLGYEAKDVYSLRQQIKELRLQQERDQLRSRIRGYVQQMMNDHRRFLARDGGFGGSIDQFDYNATGFRGADSLRTLFKPLDLPNVAAFKRPDFEEDNAADLDNERYLNLPMIRERVLGIQYWLKQQFVLYRDYSSLVSTINAKYIPVTLKETKKMINDMQRFYNNHERRRGHVR